MQRLLIVGFGDVAHRLAPRLVQHYRVCGLIRNPAQAATLRALGVRPIVADLDQADSLGRLAGLADVIVHLAPPAASGHRDQRTRHLLAGLGRLRPGVLSGRESSQGRRMLPHQLVYISTSGVYGDCAGAWVDETRPAHPESARAVRRVDAERTLREWGIRNACRVSILRVPGIYAADRLPLERLRRGLPALCSADDAYTNHIHADDLAAAIQACLQRGKPGRVYNCVDNSALRMGDYFDLVADRFGLPRPPRVTRAEAAAQIPETMLSFMRESRRLHNRRLLGELGLRLTYPTVADALPPPGHR